MNWGMVHIARVLASDTAFSRLIVAMGLVLLGGSMLFGLGAGEPGYVLMEEAWPIQFWGAIYLGVGLAGVHGALSDRLPYWYRIALCVVSMYLWVFLTVAQFADVVLPTRMLLLLPATVEVFVLVKLVAVGQRRN